MPLQLKTNSSALVVPAGSPNTNSAAVQDIRPIRDPVPLGPDLTWLWIVLDCPRPGRARVVVVHPQESRR
jgi:hypothetical protein